jgi:hypothetical protein
MIRLLVTVALGLGALALPHVDASAAQVNIVALGASNTYGMGRGKTAGGVTALAGPIRPNSRHC